jgi:hypothetical protein
MPLEKSGSDAARQRNIAEMIKSGHPPNQAVAAGYANQRAHKHGHPHNTKHGSDHGDHHGGSMKHYSHGS